MVMSAPEARAAIAVEAVYVYPYQESWLSTGIDIFISFYAQVVASGRATTTYTVTLPGNAVVRELELELRADRASWTGLGAAGQVRVQGSTVIVDFGLPRTVAGVGVRTSSGLSIRKVLSWTGAKFDPDPVFGDAPSGVLVAMFAGEIQTQRLQIDLMTSATASAVESDLAVQLPDLPANLELRIDGGAPVFSHDGVVQAGDRGWTSTSDGRTTRRVSLGAALAALTGDSQDTADRTFTITLSSQAPGLLELSEVARDVDRVWLTDLGPDARRELDFDAEGFEDVALNVGGASTGRLRELRATLAASFGPERALPPVGPPASTHAELLLNADRAAAVRLSIARTSDLRELIAVRVPLAAGEQGAELRVAVAAHDPDTNSPGDLTRAPQSKPLVLPPAGASESWVTLELAAPFKLDDDALPWLVLLVTRGDVTWSLASDGSELDAELQRCGSPAGPWELFPDYLTAQAHGRARLHLVGHADKLQPLAPLQGEASEAGASYDASAARADLTATQKGTRNVWVTDVALNAKPMVLRVTSRLAGTVTLSALEAVVSDA